MAFDIQYLSPVGNQSKRGRTPQYFTYRTADSLATVVANNYFDAAKSMLEEGDKIEVEFVDSVATPTQIVGRTTVEVALKIDGVIKALDVGFRKVIMSTVLADVSTASDSTITVQTAGTVDAIFTVLGGAITVGDAAITFDIGGTAITNSAITVANAGSAKGDIDSSAPTAAKTLAAGNALKVTTDGGSTGAQPLYVFYVVTV